MSLGLVVTLVVFVLIFILKMPIAIGMLSASACYLLITGADLSLVVNQVMNTFYTNYVIIAVPLFIFTANVMNSGKVTEMVFKFCNGVCKNLQGALGQVNILGSLIFSGMTGSAIADAAGLGKIEIQAMKDQGYDDGFSCAVTAASATIGPIFPPSIPLVIYAMLSSTSVGALFMGGMIPAILLTIALMIYVGIVSKKRRYPKGEPISRHDFKVFVINAIPALLTPVVLLVGIYTGIMTPTEAGAVAGLYALLISIFAYHAMGWKELIEVIKQTIKDIGATSIMIGASTVISYIVAREGLASSLGAWILSITTSKYQFLLLVNLVILLLGMFIDTSTIQLVFVPIMIPVARALGIDMIHFGLVVTFNMMVGLSTPPFGMLLFITSGISGTPLKKIMKEIMWPIVVMLIVLVLITYIPEIVLFLPKAAGLI
ncbi:MAG: TRAP transporter large permease [Sphaerochaetaceae bacterium]|jgi:tripartite ATP-independent transporter DctM subunit|nr:TRAP transporter large permease [Candidatus Cloacimonadota bacterium]